MAMYEMRIFLCRLRSLTQTTIMVLTLIPLSLILHTSVYSLPCSRQSGASGMLIACHFPTLNFSVAPHLRLKSKHFILVQKAFHYLLLALSLASSPWRHLPGVVYPIPAICDSAMEPPLSVQHYKKNYPDRSCYLRFYNTLERIKLCVCLCIYIFIVFHIYTHRNGVIRKGKSALSFES